MQKNSTCYRRYKYWLRYAIVVAVLIRSVSTGTLTDPQKAAARGAGEFSMSSQGPVSVYLTMTLAFTSVISTTFRMNLIWCVSAIIQISAMNLKLLYASQNRGFSRRPCWRAETMKQLHENNLISQRRENVLFLHSNMAAMTSHENAL